MQQKEDKKNKSNDKDRENEDKRQKKLGFNSNQVGERETELIE